MMKDFKLHQSSDQALRLKAMDFINDGVMICGPDGHMAYMDPSMGRMIGINPAKLQGHPQELSAHIQFSGGFTFEQILEVIERDGEWVGEAAGVSAEGATVLLDVRARRLDTAQGKTMGFILVSRDVTRERTLERQVLQSQQMELVDNMSIGIAHEFKNLLTVIMAYASLLQNQLEGQSYEKDIAKILETADKANDLTTRLMAVTRRAAPRIQKVDVLRVLVDVAAMLRKTLPANINLYVPEKISVPSIATDPAILSRALLNLCLNAKDAMPQGGSLTIEVDYAQVEKDDLQQWPDRKPGTYVTVSVTDTGHGMTPEVKAHIFEPFFTTKKGGTGLGLSVVQHTIKSVGGWITVYAEPEIGTCFRLYIPAASADEKTGEKSADDTQVLPGNETILVIDDDPLVLNVAQRFLEKSGYTVWTAPGGEEGLQTYKLHSNEINLVVLDVVMPHMQGEEVYRELVKINPSLAILVVSGFSPKTAERLLKTSGARMLAKPFTRGRLTREIRDILDRKKETKA